MADEDQMIRETNSSASRLRGLEDLAVLGTEPAYGSANAFGMASQFDIPLSSKILACDTVQAQDTEPGHIAEPPLADYRAASILEVGVGLVGIVETVECMVSRGQGACADAWCAVADPFSVCESWIQGNTRAEVRTASLDTRLSCQKCCRNLVVFLRFTMCSRFR